MRIRAFTVGLLLLSTATACTEPPAPAPPPPPPSASPATLTPPYEPEALMAAVSAAVKRVDDSADIRPGEIETGEVWIGFRPCDLLVADPLWERTVEFDAMWSGTIEVNPVPSFQSVEPPITVLNIQVVHLADTEAASAAVKRVHAMKCPTGDFPLNIGLASARRESRMVKIGSTNARLTTATVQRVKPGNDLSLDYLPGDARLVLAHGPLLINVEALALLPRTDNSAAEITAAARKQASALAIEILQALS